MSYHWENVTWQSRDGSWNRGFYTRLSREPNYGSESDGEDYDSEWDDDFDLNSFDTVRTGFRSATSAAEWMPYGNPGGTAVIYYRGNSKECKALDQLAFFHFHPEEKAKQERKEFLKKNREHFKALEAEWTPERISEFLGNRSRLTAQIKKDDRAYSPLGIVVTATGVPLREGNWFLINGKRIYNLKTAKFEKHVHKLETVYGDAGYRLGTTSRSF